MTEPTKATTYNLFEDRGDGSLYLVQIFQTLAEAQRMGRFHVMRAANEGTILHECVVVRCEMTEADRIDRAAAEAFALTQDAIAGAPNVVDLSAPKR